MLTAIAILCTCLAMVVGVWAAGWVASVHRARQAADLSALAAAQAQVLAAASPPAQTAGVTTAAPSAAVRSDQDGGTAGGATGHASAKGVSATGSGSTGQGVESGAVCAAAARVATVNKARLLACHLEGDPRDFVVHVTVQVDLTPRVGTWHTTSWTSAAGSEPR